MDGIEIPRHWRLKQQRYKLIGSICPQCENTSLMPRPVCPICSIETVQEPMIYEITQRQNIKPLYIEEKIYLTN
jgi:uncharacterized OB-fold protein